MGAPESTRVGCAAGQGTHLQLSLEEELLWALGAVVDLVFLPMHSKDVLLQLVGLDEDWTWTWTRPSEDTGDTSPATHRSCPTPLPSGDHPGMDTAAKQWAIWSITGTHWRGLKPVKLSSATHRLCNIGQVT